MLAPLLCAGLIGWRSLVMAGGAGRKGLPFFLAPLPNIPPRAPWRRHSVSDLYRPVDPGYPWRCKSTGGAWAGTSEDSPPDPLDAAIIFVPAGSLVPAALKAVRKGGRVVCAGIHMSDIPSFPYALLWEERQVMSVANLTRQDGINFLGSIVPKAGIEIHTTSYPLRDANRALDDLRAGRFEGAAVLVP